MLIRIILFLTTLSTLTRAGCPAGSSCDSSGTATTCAAGTYAPTDSYMCYKAPPGKELA